MWLEQKYCCRFLFLSALASLPRTVAAEELPHAEEALPGEHGVQRLRVRVGDVLPSADGHHRSHRHAEAALSSIKQTLFYGKLESHEKKTTFRVKNYK